MIAVTDPFDVGDMLAVVQDAVADLVAKGESVEYGLDVTELLKNPDLLNSLDAV